MFYVRVFRGDKPDVYVLRVYNMRKRDHDEEITGVEKLRERLLVALNNSLALEKLTTDDIRRYLKNARKRYKEHPSEELAGSIKALELLLRHPS